MMPLNTIHCGDCMDVMNDIDSNGVDCIVTDPPYFLINNSGSGTTAIAAKMWAGNT